MGPSKAESSPSQLVGVAQAVVCHVEAGEAREPLHARQGLELVVLDVEHRDLGEARERRQGREGVVPQEEAPQAGQGREVVDGRDAVVRQVHRLGVSEFGHPHGDRREEFRRQAERPDSQRRLREPPNCDEMFGT